MCHKSPSPFAALTRSISSIQQHMISVKLQQHKASAWSIWDVQSDGSHTYRISALDGCQLGVSVPLGSRLSNFLGAPTQQPGQPADPTCPRAICLQSNAGLAWASLCKAAHSGAGSRLCCSAKLEVFKLEAIWAQPPRLLIGGICQRSQPAVTSHSVCLCLDTIGHKVDADLCVMRRCCLSVFSSPSCCRSAACWVSR